MAVSQLIEGEDYYIDVDGLLVMTEAYLRKRGTCCENGCRHCPYGFAPRDGGSARRDDAGRGSRKER